MLFGLPGLSVLMMTRSSRMSWVSRVTSTRPSILEFIYGTLSDGTRSGEILGIGTGDVGGERVALPIGVHFQLRRGDDIGATADRPARVRDWCCRRSTDRATAATGTSRRECRAPHTDRARPGSAAAAAAAVPSANVLGGCSVGGGVRGGISRERRRRSIPAAAPAGPRRAGWRPKADALPAADC